MKIAAIDITIDASEAAPFHSEGVAYYRLPNELMEFFKLCHEKHVIAGFEWDPEDPRLFGLILKNPRKDGKGE